MRSPPPLTGHLVMGNIKFSISGDIQMFQCHTTPPTLSQDILGCVTSTYFFLLHSYQCCVTPALVTEHWCWVLSKFYMAGDIQIVQCRVTPSLLSQDISCWTCNFYVLFHATGTASFQSFEHESPNRVTKGTQLCLSLALTESWQCSSFALKSCERAGFHRQCECFIWFKTST